MSILKKKMMKSNLFFTRPLEISFHKRKQWEQCGHTCFAIVDDKETVRRYTLEYAQNLFRQTNTMYVVMWAFCFNTNAFWCMEILESVKLVKQRDDLLVYEIENEDEIETFIELWGETDHMEFVFPIEKESFICSIETREFSNFNRFRRSFLKRLSQTIAVISDSGDGEESQFVIEKVEKQ